MGAMMNQKLLFLLLLLMLPLAANADTLGIKLGAASWRYDVTGDLRYKSKNSADDIDVENDLGYDNDTLTFAYLIFEHPVPVLPNVKLSYTNIDTSGRGTLSSTFNYGGSSFTIGDIVNSDIQLKQTDITLYYSLLDNWVNLDVGLNAKYIDSKANITSTILGTSKTADVSTWVPMLYAGVGFDLPLTGLGVSADGSYIGYSGSNFYDFSVRLSYDTPWFLGVDVGYRKVNLSLDDISNSYADISFDGYYGGLYLHF